MSDAIIARLRQIESEYETYLAQEAVARTRIDDVVQELLAIRRDYVLAAEEAKASLEFARQTLRAIEGLADEPDAADWWKQ